VLRICRRIDELQEIIQNIAKYFYINKYTRMHAYARIHTQRERELEKQLSSEMYDILGNCFAFSILKRNRKQKILSQTHNFSLYIPFHFNFIVAIFYQRQLI